ncbi:MAG: peptidyl-prolyl cis-trans isomerase [Proteobacteria bacterium]|nr:peptidyl-prolyl cis-trans isomerase [Pseudomonadota bacterium]
MKRAIGAMTLVAALAAALGCGSKGVPDADAEKKAVAEPLQAKPAAKSGSASVETGGPRPVAPPLEKLSASHILIMHAGSERPKPGVTRTKAEALALAEELYAKLEKGADFAGLARKHSDCPSGVEEGGDLGIFPAGRMTPAFSDAVRALETGEISKPIETPFGYHLIKRQKVEEIHARHILVMHQGSKRKPASVTRSEDEARTLIGEIVEKLKDGADFAALAREHSDCPSGKRKGGDLGTFAKGKMAPPFEKAAFALEENQISDIVETDFGFHVIQRLP